MGHQWDFASVLANTDALLAGAAGTLRIFAICLVTGLALGLVVGLGRYARAWWFHLPATAFVEFFRNTPVLVQIIWFYFALPILMPFSISPLAAASLGISLNSAAFSAEIYRAGIQSIDRGQYEGADSLGLGYWQKMRLIILPQALKLVIPGIVNTFIGLFKDTSLVYIVNMFDLLGAVRRNFNDANWITPQTPLSGLVFAGFVFWCFCFGMSRYSAYMERRLDTGHRK